VGEPRLWPSRDFTYIGFTDCPFWRLRVSVDPRRPGSYLPLLDADRLGVAFAFVCGVCEVRLRVSVF